MVLFLSSSGHTAPTSKIGNAFQDDKNHKNQEPTLEKGLVHSDEAPKYVPQDVNCNETRAVFLMGESSISAKLSEVNKCKQKIISEKANLSIPLDYSQNIEVHNNKKQLSQGAIYQTILNIIELKKQMNIDCQQIKCIGILEPTILEAQDNLDLFLNYIQKDQYVTFYKLSPKELGQFSFAGVLAGDYSVNNQIKVIIMKLKSNSFQISYQKDNDIKTSTYPFGTKDFYKQALNIAISSSMTERNSPNPFSILNVEEAKNIIENNLLKFMKSNSDLENLIDKNVQVYLMGEVVEGTVLPLVSNGTKEIKIINLLNMTTQLTGRTDDDIARRFPIVKDFASSVLVNIIYTFGIMNINQIEELKVIGKVTDLDGLLVVNKYWSEFKELYLLQ
jgi:hypothetical protein